MRILVTGPTGFIGGRLVPRLLEDDHEVTCLARDPSKAGNWKMDSGVSLVRGDVTDPRSLEEGLAGDWDCVFHLAGAVYSDNQRWTFAVNAGGTENVLGALDKGNIGKFVLLSSIAAIGPARHGEYLNEETPTRPINDYGRSKLEAEGIAERMCAQKGWPFVAVRGPVVYGPGVSPQSRVTTMFEMIRSGKYRMVGTGENRIGFCYIDNMIHGLTLVLKAPIENRETFLIADAQSLKICELAERIVSLIHPDMALKKVPKWLALLVSMIPGTPQELSPGRIREMVGSWGCRIDRARTVLGYEPPLSLEEGLRLTAEWFQREVWGVK